MVISAGGRGGKGGDSNNSGGAAGLGGGAVKIIAENINIGGTILCDGGEGGTTGPVYYSTGGGGGGGSGGGILVSGKNIEFGEDALLSVKGGSGGGTGDASRYGSGGGGGGGAGGRIKIFRENPLIGRSNLTLVTTGGSGGQAYPESGFYAGISGDDGEIGNHSFNQNSFASMLEYRSPGIYVTDPFDTGTHKPHFDQISMINEIPQDTSVDLYVQTASSSLDDPGSPGEWSEWSGPYGGPEDEITSPQRRWFRVKAVLQSEGMPPHDTPFLDKLEIAYHTDENPDGLSLDIIPSSINPAKADHAHILVDFTDPDDEAVEVFSGSCTLKENSTKEEWTLLNGTFSSDDNTRISRLSDGTYRINITVMPPEYDRDGNWDVSFALFDGVTERQSIGYGQVQKRLFIDTNHEPVLYDDSVSVSNSRLPIGGEYSTFITFELEDEDPYPLDDFLFTIKIRSDAEEFSLISEKTISQEDGLELVEMRGVHKIRYEFDPAGEVPEGLYQLYIEVRDDRGVSTVLDYGTEDMELDLRANLPPDAPGWILPRETGEQMPRIVWETARDPDGDQLTYAIRIGTARDGDDVLRRTSTGPNNFYDITVPLPFGDYFVQVWSHDSLFYSPAFQAGLKIEEDLNIPPRPPTSIMPNFTKEINPLIKWSGAYDMDGDNLTYSIQIGESSGGAEVLAKVSTGSSANYRVQDPLLRDKDYYVQVWAYDGRVESPPLEEVITVLTKGNHRPDPPAAIYPDVTGEKRPTISWKEGVDSDDDELTYSIQIGTTLGGGDILTWTPTGTETSYTMITDMDYGTYFVQVKCHDGTLDSPIAEETLNIWAVGNIPPTPPSMIEPLFTVKRYPDISWMGADDENEADRDLLVYFVQIGAHPDGNEMLSWQLTSDPFYNVTTFLPDGIYYVQVKTFDLKINSSVYQQKLYVGTFKPSISVTPSELEVERGGIYEFRVNITNLGTIPDRMRLVLPVMEGIDIAFRNGSMDRDNINIAPGEHVEYVLALTVMNSFTSGETALNFTLTSLSGMSAGDTLGLAEKEEVKGSIISRMSGEVWFWPLVLAVVLLLVVIAVMIVRKRGRYESVDHDFTESLSVKKDPTPIKKKKSGGVTRISDTPIMDPRAKRIAMAIYGAEQAQLAPRKKKDLPALPESTRHLPKIMVPDIAVGSSVSKRVMEMKALPVASVVSDIDSRAPISQGTLVNEGTGVGEGTVDQPPVTMNPEEMAELTGTILTLQGKLLEYRQRGTDVRIAEEKLLEANRLFGQKNAAPLRQCLTEIKGLMDDMDVGSADAPARKLDFEVKMPGPVSSGPATGAPPRKPAEQPGPPVVEHPKPPAAGQPGPPTAEPPAPPGPPEDLPPPGENKDVFADLQKALDGMK